MSSRDANEYDDAYNEGYRDGRHAGVMDSITHSNPYHLTHGSDSRHAASYSQGWKDSGKDQYHDSYDNYHGNGDYFSSDDYSGSSDSSSSGLCFVTTACVTSKGLPDDCYELETLRGFRRDYVLQLKGGVELNEEYKKIAPIIVANINRRNDSQKIYDEIYSKINDMIVLINGGDNEKALDSYKRMVGELSSMFNL